MPAPGPGHPGLDLTRSRSAGRPPSLAAFLARGLLAGLVAGLAAFAVAFVVGEPALSAAIALESAAGHPDHDHVATGAPAAPTSGTVVPRAVQSTLGLATGTVVAGASLGGLFGVLTALALGRLGRTGPRGTALALVGVGLVALQLVPFWAYPPNPPGVGEPGTLALRTQLYLLLLAISTIAAVAALVGGRALQPRWGSWYAGWAAAGGYLLVVAVVVGLLPRYDEVPAGYPATLLYRFRAGSLLTSLALWLALGIALAELVSRLARRARPPAGSAA